MTDSQPPLTTKCGLDASGRFLSGSQHPDWKGSLEPGMGNARFGSWTIVAREIQRRGRHIYARVRCDCGTEDWKVLDNLRRGRSTQCKSCRTTNMHKKAGHLLVTSPDLRSLQGRASAIFQRCKNPKDPSFKNYGQRGVQCRFPSVKALVNYLCSLHPAEDWAGFDIDRIDNNGHYAEGNIRRATRSQNLLNRRVSMTSKTPDPAIVLPCPES